MHFAATAAVAVAAADLLVAFRDEKAVGCLVGYSFSAKEEGAADHWAMCGGDVASYSLVSHELCLVVTVAVAGDHVANSSYHVVEAKEDLFRAHPYLNLKLYLEKEVLASSPSSESSYHQRVSHNSCHKNRPV